MESAKPEDSSTGRMPFDMNTSDSCKRAIPTEGIAQGVSAYILHAGNCLNVEKIDEKTRNSLLKSVHISVNTGDNRKSLVG